MVRDPSLLIIKRRKNMPTVEEVKQALKTVVDPEIHLNIVVKIII